jgi:LL-diaminopimelate aminotransferase
MMSRRAKRLQELPPYLFAEIERRLTELQEAGQDVINFGIGDPDQPTPEFIVEKLAEAAREPATHRYPTTAGTAEFFEKRFGVQVDPQREVLALMGAKEGLAHLPLAVVNAGEVLLLPDPAYPVYRAAALFAGGVAHDMPLRASNNWLPDLDAIPPDVAHRAALMYLNYPNNPTAATAPLEFFERAVRFAREHGIVIAHDAAYAELYLGPRSPSILQVPGGKDVAIEFHSLSKTFNMSGWRLGFAVGNEKLIDALRSLKSNIDSGVFLAVQVAGTAALQRFDDVEVRALQDIYRTRRDVLVEGLNRLGFRALKPQATFYVWAACPEGYGSQAMASRMLTEARVLALPGAGFGKGGKGYLRFALTLPTERIHEAIERLSKVRWDRPWDETGYYGQR